MKQVKSVPATTALVFLLGVCVANGAEQVAETAAPSTFITHVTVIDVASGREARDQTVVVAGERILEVRATTRDDPPAGAMLIDGSGKFLIPGLWDMHVHGNNDPWYADWFSLYIANGVTGVREMFGPADANHFRFDLAARHIDAPHIYMASPIVDGDPPAWAESAVVKTPQEARRFVEEQKARGADFVKVYNYLGRAEYFAILNEAKHLHIPVAGHVPFAIAAEEASEAGQVTIEHLYGISTACSSHEKPLQARLAIVRARADRHAIDLEAFRTYSDAKCRRLFSLFKRNGTWPVPTLAVFNADFSLEADPTHSDPRLRYFFGEGRKWLRGDYSTYPEQNTAAQIAYERENFAFMIKLTGALFRARVPMLAGTDTGNAYTLPGFSLHDELALMVQSGATPLAALQTATRNPAIFMQMTDKYGAVASGRIADIVMLDADPLVDIHNTTKIAAVLLAGKEFDRAALNLLLSGAEARAVAAK